MNDILPKKRFRLIILAVTVIGIAWIVIAGIARNSFWITATSLLSGIICCGGSLKLYSLRSERAFSILGTAILWCVVTNFIYANLLTLSIPYELSDANAPFLAAQLATLNIQIGLVSVIGFMLIIIDLTKGKWH